MTKNNLHEKEALQPAIEHLYTTFAAYPLRRAIPACPGCVSPAEQERLHLVALRDLKPDDLHAYTVNALWTWGDLEDFKHFLPRYLELLSSHRYPDWYELDLLSVKMKYARWQTWPAEERKALESYFIRVWRAVLSSSYPSTHPNFGYARLFLRFIAQCTAEQEAFLDLWRQTQSLSALRHLAEFVRQEAFFIAAHRAVWWYEGQWDHISAWLLNARTRQILEEAFYRYYAEPFAPEFMQAHDQISQLIL
ncbi:MAG: hypothetical protein M3Z08_19460 [Chloroflexota bacterium]|nr:hypothetical protein [Chloroflexota bacterium]